MVARARMQIGSDCMWRKRRNEHAFVGAGVIADCGGVAAHPVASWGPDRQQTKDHPSTDTATNARTHPGMHA